MIINKEKILKKIKECDALYWGIDEHTRSFAKCRLNELLKEGK